MECERLPFCDDRKTWYSASTECFAIAGQSETSFVGVERRILYGLKKDKAEKALAIIRDVIKNTRDDLVAHNWNVIWMIYAFVIFSGAATGTVIDW